MDMRVYFMQKKNFRLLVTPIFPHSYNQFSVTMVVNNIFIFEFEIKFNFFFTAIEWATYFIYTQFDGK